MALGLKQLLCNGVCRLMRKKGLKRCILGMHFRGKNACQSDFNFIHSLSFLSLPSLRRSFLGKPRSGFRVTPISLNSEIHFLFLWFFHHRPATAVAPSAVAIAASPLLPLLPLLHLSPSIHSKQNQVCSLFFLFCVCVCKLCKEYKILLLFPFAVAAPPYLHHPLFSLASVAPLAHPPFTSFHTLENKEYKILF